MFINESSFIKASVFTDFFFLSDFLMPDLIQLIETYSQQAWPAPQQTLLEGWHIRYGGGYTRRANCVNPVAHQPGDVDARINQCEEFYRALDQPVVFRITPLIQPPDLDVLLEKRGYRHEALTSVQVLETLPASAAADPELEIAGVLNDDWLQAFAALSGVSRANQSALSEILGGISTDRAFAALYPEESGRDNPPAATGLAVLQEDTLGLFDVVTDIRWRGRGLAGRLMDGLLGWGRSRGGTRAYLQVMEDNLAALGLYHKLGFRHLYHYHYRVKVL